MNSNYLIVLGLLLFLKFNGENNMLYFALALIAMYFLMDNGIEGMPVEDGTEDLPVEDGTEDLPVEDGTDQNDLSQFIDNNELNLPSGVDIPALKQFIEEYELTKTNLKGGMTIPNLFAEMKDHGLTRAEGKAYTTIHNVIRGVDYTTEQEQTLNTAFADDAAADDDDGDDGAIDDAAADDDDGDDGDDDAAADDDDGDDYDGDDDAIDDDAIGAAADPCFPDPCQNGSSCTGEASGGYTCACQVGYSGVNCEILPCHGVDCGTHGSCISSPGSDLGYSCNCQAGYEFSEGSCQTKRVPASVPPSTCPDTACGENETCENGVCICDLTHTGDTCDSYSWVGWFLWILIGVVVVVLIVWGGRAYIESQNIKPEAKVQTKIIEEQTSMMTPIKTAV